MSTRNVTLTLPDDLLKRARILAARQDTSVSALVRDLLAGLVDDGPSYDRMWTEEEAVMASGPLRVGDKPVSRGELHER